MRFYWGRWRSFGRWRQARWGHPSGDIAGRPLVVGMWWGGKDWEAAGAITRRHGIRVCCLRGGKKVKEGKRQGLGKKCESTEDVFWGKSEK